MSEEFLQYIWKYQLYEQKTYHTLGGEEIQIIYPGDHNTDAGPDFSNTKIRIDGTLWVGNCEVHLNASDWEKHNHHKDKAYDNVVLHVTSINNYSAKTTTDRIIPTIELSYNPQIEDNYIALKNSNYTIPCYDKLGMIERFYISSWLTKLLIERLETKVADIRRTLESVKMSWEEAFYIHIASSFGFKVNSNPFEMLARSVPLSVLQHHKNNLQQIEALLFGQSGLLPKNDSDNYIDELRKEYGFLQKKYSLKPLEMHLWKFLRLRPVNFPTIRIAQFASLVYQSHALFSKILEAESTNELVLYFNISASGYWDNHYQLGKISKNQKKKFSESSIELIILNTIIPFLFAYGRERQISKYEDRAISILEELKPEKNSIIAKWSEYGIEARNSFESQALLQLKNQYCVKRRCLNCSIGNRIISNKI